MLLYLIRRGAALFFVLLGQLVSAAVIDHFGLFGAQVTPLTLMRAGGMFYRNGSGANMLACVAAGRLGGYVEDVMNPWDSLAGLLMIREAGGITHPYPADATLGLCMGAAPGVWDKLHEVVAAQFPGGLPEAQR